MQPVSMRERMPMTERFTVHSFRIQPSPSMDSITLRVEQLGGRQVARPRVDRRLFIIEAKQGLRLRGKRQIGVVESLDRPDIFPVILEQIRLHIVLARRRGRSSLPKSVCSRRLG